MTQQRDIERLLDHWFSDGPDQASDRVVDIVTDRIERQSQRPAWRLHWRPSTLNAYAKIAVAAAAVLLVALVGYNLLPAGSTGTGGRAPTAAPTLAPTASPATSATASPGAVFPSWFPGGSGAGILPAGIGTTRFFTPGFTFNVPEGWVNGADSADDFGLFPDTPANKAEYALSRGLAQAIYMAQVQSPSLICEAAGGPEGGATAAELVDSLAANKAFATSEPVDVAIGGLRGRQVDFKLDPGWTGSCPLGPDDPPTRDYRDYRGRGIFLDTTAGGHLLIIIDSLYSADFDALLAQAMPVVESFQFETGQ
jgi:hypothetical protein